MTAPADTSGLALIQAEVRHQNSALERIERKLDKVTDDHEARLRILEAADPAGTREIVKKMQEADPAGTKEAVEVLQASDKRWAAAAIVLAFVVPAVMRVVWP